MYIRHRMSISDIRHCQRYVEMNTYDVVCVTYDVVCWRTTLYVTYMSYVTYDVARTMSYVYTLYIARTTSYVRCSTRCRTSHVRCRTCMTYDIVRDVRHRRWQESRWWRHGDLSVLKSHFKRACIGLFKQLLSKSEKRFVRTHWLQEVLGLSEVLWVRLFYLLVSVSFDSEDLKRLRALSPLGQKHAFWNRTGNLPIVQRNVLTTEPRLQIWHIKMRIIAIIKSNCKKKFTTRKTCWIAVWLPANSGAESHNADRTWQL